MTKLLIAVALLFFSVCFASDGGNTAKQFEFNYHAFRIDGMVVSMTPKYGKIYGQIDAIEVGWTITQPDSSGRKIMVTDKETIPVESDLRGAYFKAKSIFMDKQRSLQNQFEDAFLPPEKEYRQKK